MNSRLEPKCGKKNSIDEPLTQWILDLRKNGIGHFPQLRYKRILNSSVEHSLDIFLYSFSSGSSRSSTPCYPRVPWTVKLGACSVQSATIGLPTAAAAISTGTPGAIHAATHGTHGTDVTSNATTYECISKR